MAESETQSEPAPIPDPNAGGSARGLSYVFDSERLVRRVLLTWLIIGLSLFLLDAIIEYWRPLDHKSIRRLFNFARDDGIGTWFASLQATGVAVVLWLVRCRKRSLGVSGRRVAAWTFLAGFFLYIAIDDGAKIHERVGTFFGDLSGSDGLAGAFPSYTWQVVYGPVFGTAALLIVWVWFKELVTARARVMIAMGLASYVLAVFLDFVEGIDGLHESLASGLGVRDYTISHFSRTTEELIEMAGTTLFLCGFLHHLLRLTHEVRLSFGHDD